MSARLRIQPADGAPPFEVEFGNTATIGRSRDNTVPFPGNAHVSRQHAVLRCHNGFDYQIMDLGSRNGTFVDGRRVILPVTLENGALIRIGGHELVFEQTAGDSGQETLGATLAAASQDGSGHRVERAAILVCDIRGFSTYSEKIAPEEIARTIGCWFREAGNLIHASGGTIDKFIGDALLAYWCAHGSGGSCDAALGVGRALHTLAATMRWPTPEPAPLRVGVAMHYGTVTCGNIGIEATRDATIIGDAVNTAFRLESVMKELGEELLASEPFVRALSAADGCRDLGERSLKGKAQPIKVFGVTR